MSAAVSERARICLPPHQTLALWTGGAARRHRVWTDGAARLAGC